MNIYTLSFFYFFLGVLLNLADLAVNLYLISKGVEVSDLAAFNALMIVPWCIKPLYGILSDSFPVLGERRRPYIIGSNLLAACVWIIIATKTNLNVQSIQALLFLCSMMTCFGDVMYDSLLVVEAKKERDGEHGNKQSTCWIARAAGATIAAFTSGMLLLNIGPPTIFCAQATIHLLVCGSAIIYIAEDPCVHPYQPLTLRLKQVVTTFKRPKLFRPALFMFVFGATPSSYMAFFYYLVAELKFSTALLGGLKSIRHLAMLFGTIIFQRYFRNVHLRHFFIVMVLLSSVLGATPLVLVTHINRTIGVPDELFVGGDDLFLSVFAQISILPILVLTAKLCPSGIEASLYAIFVSILNFSGVISDFLGAKLTQYFEITRENFHNLPVLITVCTLSTLLSLAFINCLPAGTIATATRKAATVQPREDDEERVYLTE